MSSLAYLLPVRFYLNLYTIGRQNSCLYLNKTHIGISTPPDLIGLLVRGEVNIVECTLYISICMFRYQMYSVVAVPSKRVTTTSLLSASFPASCCKAMIQESVLRQVLNLPSKLESMVLRGSRDFTCAAYAWS